MEDLTQLYYNTINTPEFKQLLQRLNAANISKPVQIKRGNIQFQNDEEIWVLYSNGTVRRQYNYADRLGKVKEFKNFQPTVENMLTLIEVVNSSLDRREKTFNSRLKKMEKQKSFIFGVLFDNEKYKYEDTQYMHFQGFRLRGTWREIIDNMYSHMNKKPGDWGYVVKVK